MQNLVVRQSTLTDVQEIRKICSEDLGYPCELSLVKEKMQNIESTREIVFVALLDECVAGFIHVEKYNLLYLETMANILSLAVKEKYRNKGIGKKLIQMAEEWALENHIFVMRLDSGILRKNAHNFYRHLGYRVEKEQLRFIKMLDQ